MAFVDIQGFKVKSNIFILKEIAVLTKNSSFHDIIKSPFSYESLNIRDKKQIKWLTRNYHGFSWKAGSISMEELRRIIKPMLKDEKNIYVKGGEKVQWLHFILDCKKMPLNIINIESIGCEMKMNQGIGKEIYTDICKKHPNHFHCALKNVLELSEWYLKTQI